MAIIKQPTQIDIGDWNAGADRFANDHLGRKEISQDPTNQKWAKYMQDLHGWSTDQTYTSILNYGMSQLNDFYRSDTSELEKQLGKKERVLADLFNALNPKSLDNLTDAQKKDYLKTRKAEVDSTLKWFKDTATGQFKSLLDPGFIDKYNSAIASAANFYGNDVLKDYKFQSGGTKNEITVDYIGDRTGQSQPITFKIDPKTGEFDVGEIPDVQKQVLGLPVQKDSRGLEYVEVNGKKYAADPNNTALQQALGQSGGQGKQGTGNQGTSGDTVLGLPVKTDERGLRYVEVNGVRYAADETNQALKNALQQSGTGTGTSGTGTGTSGTGSSINQSGDLAAALKIIDDYEAKGILPPAIADMYRTIAENWDPSVPLNAENVVKEFKKIRDNTIDPYLQGISNLTINNISTAIENQKLAREMETESEGATAKANIEGTKEELAQRGLTFTGKGIQALGSESAYAGIAKEGTVQQSNRLVASSSLARYKEAMQGIGAKAEASLGTGALGSFNLPYYTPAGGVEGDIKTERDRVYGGVFSQLINQQKENILGQQPVDYNFNLTAI